MADVLNGDDGVPDNVRSIADRANGGEEGDGEQEELFPLGTLEGDKKTLAQIIRKGLPVETTVSLMSAEVPLRGGLPDPDKLHRALITAEVAKLTPVPVREDGKIVSWKVRVSLRPTYVEAVEGQEAATG
jgi:hypothetical protein